MIEIIGIALSILTALFVAYPLFQKNQRKVSFALNHQAEDLQARKEEIYAAIRDIDFDYRMGKLSEEDYASLRDQYKTEAINLMKRVDQMTLGSSKTRTKGAATSATARKFCHQCGEPVTAADKFCSSCGVSLS